MIKKTLQLKEYRIVVFGRQDHDGFVPLKFDVYFNHIRINEVIRQKTVIAIEEYLSEKFKKNRN